MTERVGVRALQQHASEVARLVPLAESPLAALTEAGLARRARAAMRDLPPPLPDTADPSLSEILADQRTDER